MKTLFASLFAALFALVTVSAYAATPVGAGFVAANSDDSKDDAKKPDGTDSKSDEDKKKPEEDDKKS